MYPISNMNTIKSGKYLMVRVDFGQISNILLKRFNNLKIISTQFTMAMSLNICLCLCLFLSVYQSVVGTISYKISTLMKYESVSISTFDLYSLQLKSWAPGKIKTNAWRLEVTKQKWLKILNLWLFEFFWGDSHKAYLGCLMRQYVLFKIAMKQYSGHLMTLWGRGVGRGRMLYLR